MKTKEEVEKELKRQQKNYEALQKSNRGTKQHHKHILEVSSAHLMTLEWVLGEKDE